MLIDCVPGGTLKTSKTRVGLTKFTPDIGAASVRGVMTIVVVTNVAATTAARPQCIAAR